MTTTFHAGAQSDAGSPDARRTCITELLAAQATATPDAVAVKSTAGTLTYRELESRATRLAAHLRSLGVGSDVLVGLCLPRCPGMVVGMLGILKAGGAYVPMDPAYPADRLAFMLEDAQAPVLVSNRSLVERLPALRSELVDIADPQLAEARRSPPLHVPTPGDLAYVIYTSGSTGQPKGVEISHGGLTNLVFWHNQAFAVTAADRASHVAGLGFDAAVWELWPYLAAGATLHLADDETRRSAELLRDWLLSQRITIGFVPTPLLEHLLGLSWPSSADLRILLTGGDVLHRRPPPGLPFLLVNNYGPTECTVVATSGPVGPDQSPATSPPIGRAIANTRIHLLDERREPVTPGEPGEIFIEGAGLARGYHNRPDLTAERFLPNPLSADRDSRLYQTGDLARLLPDGQFAFLGRKDDQIKIRGYRIEPTEISTVLDRHPDIRQSLVTVREEVAGHKRLAAYVIPEKGSKPGYRELREYLAEFLPDYMLPAAFVPLNAFPLTPHGKIDRAALPAPDPTNTLQDEVPDRPHTELEERIAEMLGELLDLEEIGLDDNFFMLGGHSLLGAQLIARLREAFGVEIGLRSLFEAPTVAALSAEVERLSPGGEVVTGNDSPAW